MKWGVTTTTTPTQKAPINLQSQSRRTVAEKGYNKQELEEMVQNRKLTVELHFKKLPQ